MFHIYIVIIVHSSKHRLCKLLFFCAKHTKTLKMEKREDMI